MKITSLCFFLLVFGWSCVSYEVALLTDYASFTGWTENIISHLTSPSLNVTLVSDTPLPPLSRLLSYDAIFFAPYSESTESNALVSLLQQYIQKSKPVVYAFLADTIDYNDYPIFPIIPNPLELWNDGPLVLVPLDPDHPILDGVTKFSGGTCSARSGTIFKTDADQVGVWSDSRKTPLIGTLSINGTRIVSLNFFVVDSSVTGGCWDPTTDGGKMMQNSVLWAIEGGSSCNGYSTCTTCTTNSCQWCLDTNQCTIANYTCLDRIAQPSDCPLPQCSSWSTCSTCLNQSGCTWCLDNNSCVSSSIVCHGEINKKKFCPSK